MKILSNSPEIMLDGDVLTSIPNLSDSNETVIYRVSATLKDEISIFFKNHIKNSDDGISEVVVIIKNLIVRIDGIFTTNVWLDETNQVL